ncbi:MAG: PadR family transcriptional regulator [Chloroflexi bacterium]|nr:MAG: PadR family transcriptional regulator [Chloroflexota bacterium]
MQTGRLFVLGMLATSGPMHGHQIRRKAELERADFWGRVKVSSLYATLRRMEEEGLIEAVERSQEGRFPARTVYGITAEGWRELSVLRDACFQDTAVAPDPFDLALSFTDDLDESEVRATVVGRLAALREQAAEMGRQQERVARYLSPLDRVVFRHFQVRIAAEVAWHEELLERLPELRSGRAPGQLRVVGHDGPAKEE